MQSSNPKPQVIWGCVYKNSSLCYRRGFCICLEAAGLELQDPHRGTSAILTHKIKNHGLTEHPFQEAGYPHPHPLVRICWPAPSTSGKPTGSTAMEQIHPGHCPPNLTHTPKQATALNIGFPSSTATACTKKALNKGRQPSRTFAECLCIIYSCYLPHLLIKGLFPRIGFLSK